MFSTYKEMKDCLRIEAGKLNIRLFWVQYLTGSEFAHIYSYMWVLRHLEYFMEVKKRHRLIGALPCSLLAIIHRHQRIKLGIHLGPNAAEPGFHIVHLGFFRAYGIAHFGRNTTVLPMVLFGKSSPNLPSEVLINVGDNCYFGTGCTVLAPCNIGNNVTVAAGAVVTMKEIPDNAVVAGIPAKIVKIKETN